jgi:uncharacterized protein YdbL (DUF1318 family)
MMNDTRFGKVELRLSTFLAASILTVAAASAVAAIGMLSAGPARADIATAKAIIDAAKASGQVGEQGDGFLGLVQSGPARPDVQSAIDEINSGRAAVYRETAAKTGVTPDAAGQAVATQLINKMPPGQFYRPLGGGWTRK